MSYNTDIKSQLFDATFVSTINMLNAQDKIAVLIPAYNEA